MESRILPVSSVRIRLLCLPMISRIRFFVVISPISLADSIRRMMIRSKFGCTISIILPPAICLRMTMQNKGAVIGFFAAAFGQVDTGMGRVGGNDDFLCAAAKPTNRHTNFIRKGLMDFINTPA